MDHGATFCSIHLAVEHFILYGQKPNVERANFISNIGNCNVFGLNLKYFCIEVLNSIIVGESIVYRAQSTYLLASGRLDEL